MLVRNTIINLFGRAAPLIVAILVIPILIKGMGVERFGILSLAWMLVGYLGLFDFGIGRALTKMVAERLAGAGNSEEIPPLVWTSLLIMLVLGTLGALLIASLSPWLVHAVLNIPEALQSESLRAFYLIAFSVPIVIARRLMLGGDAFA